MARKEKAKEKEKQIGPLIALEEAPDVIKEAQGAALFDIAIVVSATYQQIIEPIQSGRVPKRVANKIVPLLHATRPDYYGDDDIYLDMVFRTAQRMGLLTILEQVGQKARFAPGGELAVWTSLSLPEQIRRLLSSWHDKSTVWNDAAGVNYVEDTYSYYLDLRNGRRVLLEHLVKACQPEVWYSVQELLQSIKESDLLLLHTSSYYSPYNSVQGRKVAFDAWDSSDGEILIGMLDSSLNEFGVVSTGYRLPAGDKSNPYAFKLTQAGYLALQQASKQEELAAAAGHNLIVQPNFEMLLLQPDYATLYQLLPFVKVEQIDMVSRLTLTQESVRRGVEAGWAVERILEILRQNSQKELPQNVLYTLQDWSRLYKNATISQTILLEVVSETVADEICASPKLRTLELRRLGPRAIAVGSQVSMQVLRTTLEKEGVIMHIQGDILTTRDYASTAYGKQR